MPSLRFRSGIAGKPTFCLYFSFLEDVAGRQVDSDSLALLIRFIHKSQALCKVDLYSWNSTNHPISVSIVRRVFLAIAENSMIDEVDLD